MISTLVWLCLGKFKVVWKGLYSVLCSISMSVCLCEVLISNLLLLKKKGVLGLRFNSVFCGCVKLFIVLRMWTLVSSFLLVVILMMVLCRIFILIFLVECVRFVWDGVGIAVRDVHMVSVGFDDHRENADLEIGFGVSVFMVADRVWVVVVVFECGL